MFRSVVEAVFSYSETQPEKLCLADESRSVTYLQYKDEICRMASVLENMGVKKGDRIVIEASQTIEFLAAELAMQLIGAIFVPVERNCAWEKTARMVVSAEALLAITLKKPEDTNGVRHLTMAELYDEASKSDALSQYTLPEAEDVSELLFSTGTTGKEKGIVISHKNNIALAENVIHGVLLQKKVIVIVKFSASDDALHPKLSLKGTLRIDQA